MTRSMLDSSQQATYNIYSPGDMAQLGERCLRKAEATGSNPVISTNARLSKKSDSDK